MVDYAASIEYVYRTLKGTKCLFIFDNAEAYDGVHGLKEKVLGEYEKPIKATLAISMEQIEKSDKLPADCKEICKSIQNVAASGIPQDLFLHLPNATQELVLDAIHQLQSYSLFSRSTAKSKRDRTVCVSIHRLLQ